MSVPFRSVFAQLLDLIPRTQFEALVRRHKHEARAFITLVHTVS
jgi:hypothetical protein